MHLRGAEVSPVLRAVVYHAIEAAGCAVVLAAHAEVGALVAVLVDPHRQLPPAAQLLLQPRDEGLVASRQTYGTLLDCENECKQDTVILEECAPAMCDHTPRSRLTSAAVREPLQTRWGSLQAGECHGLPVVQAPT